MSLIYSIGRNKSAVAKIRIESGTGNITVNSKSKIDYFQKQLLPLQQIEKPILVLKQKNNYIKYEASAFDMHISVMGGGIMGQAKAIQLALSRALLILNQQTSDETNLNTRQILKSNGLLKRDARSKERKKFGLKKARKAPQFSKR